MYAALFSYAAEIPVRSFVSPRAIVSLQSNVALNYQMHFKCIRVEVMELIYGRNFCEGTRAIFTATRTTCLARAVKAISHACRDRDFTRRDFRPSILPKSGRGTDKSSTITEADQDESGDHRIERSAICANISCRIQVHQYSSVVKVRPVPVTVRDVKLVRPQIRRN